MLRAQVLHVSLVECSGGRAAEAVAACRPLFLRQSRVHALNRLVTSNLQLRVC
jgi:hypothetical protein